jgi:ATP-dependent HslUV protease subunit HslV
MTTIVYKDGILAYDSRITDDYNTIVGHVDKGCKTEQHLVAVCGDFTAVAVLIEWARSGFDPRQKPKMKKDASFEMVAVDKKGVIQSFEESLTPVILDDKMYAAGSGKNFAFGAMHAGATAKQAVIAAASYDAATGGRVREISFK